MKITDTRFIGGSNKSLALYRMKALVNSVNGELGVSVTSSEVSLQRRGASSILSVVDLTDRLYPFTSHTFSSPVPVGSGHTAPTLTALRTLYSGASWSASNSYFTVANGIQVWTVPVTGTYEITAEGGNNGANARASLVRCRVVLAKGQKLRILVGQCSGSSTSGSGATFVELSGVGCLLVAAGGGGYRTSGISHGSSVLTTLASAAGTNFTASSQQGFSVGCGGGGSYSQSAPTVSGGQSFISGGLGGVSSANSQNPGGFGGGGASGQNSSAYNYNYTVGGAGGWIGGSGSGRSDTEGVQAASTAHSWAIALSTNKFCTLSSSNLRKHGYCSITFISLGS